MIGKNSTEKQGLRVTWTSESQKERWKVTEGSEELGVEVLPASVTVPLCSSGPKPQEQGSVPDWAIVLITLTVAAAIVGLLYGIKKVSETVVQMCGSPRPAGLGLGCPRTLRRTGASGGRMTACHT